MQYDSEQMGSDEKGIEGDLQWDLEHDVMQFTIIHDDSTLFYYMTYVM